MIALNGVSARAGTFPLHAISFTIARGEYGVVIGPAGAGKTTLLESDRRRRPRHHRHSRTP